MSGLDGQQEHAPHDDHVAEGAAIPADITKVDSGNLGQDGGDSSGAHQPAQKDGEEAERNMAVLPVIEVPGKGPDAGGVPSGAGGDGL